MITGRHDFVTLFSGDGETGFFNYMYNGIVNSSAIEIIAFLLVEGRICDEVYDYCDNIIRSLHDRFEEIDKNAEYNQMKVIKAMQDNKVAEMHLSGTTGYGYNDDGRDTLEKVYSDIFKTEDALVRPQIICGTHALNVALSSNLRPGDELLSPVGKPYDTMDEIIGIRPSKGSLAEYGITYAQVDLLPDGGFDYEGIKNAINERTKLVTIQRSKGYASRPTLSVERIGELKFYQGNQTRCYLYG